MRLPAFLLAGFLSLSAQVRPIRLSVPILHQGLNPLLLYTEDQYFPLDLIFDRLVTMDSKGAFQPQVLERWSLSPDMREATLVVRRGLTWQDGHPLDASDILHTWKLVRTPRLRALADNQAAQIPAMELVDSHTLRIRSQAAMPTLLAELYNFYPVPKHLYGEVKDPAKHPFTWAPVGNGPYRVLPGAKPTHVSLQRWEGYRGPNPGAAAGFEFLGQASSRLEGERQSLGQRFDRLGVDLIYGSTWFENLLVHRGAPGLEAYQVLTGVQDGYEAIWFNCDGRRSVMGDVRIRQAVANLLPWDELAKERQVRPVQVAGSLWHPLSWAYDPSPKPLPKPALAAQLLDEAGWRKGPRGWRCNAQGQELVLKFFHVLPLSRQPFYRKYVDAILAAGIRVETRQVTSQQIQEVELAGTGDMWTTSWINNGPDPNGDRLLYSTEGIANRTNFARYSNPEVDRLFEAGRTEADQEARKDIYRRINRIIQRDRPLVLVEYTPTYTVLSKRVQGASLSPRGNIYGFIPGMRGWRLVP